MTSNQNPNVLSDDDRIDIWFRAKWDQFSADLDHRYGVLPPAEATARRLAILGVYVDPKKLQAIIDKRAERGSNPQPAD